MNHRISEFDTMRSIAIFIIVFHHLPDYDFNYFNLNYIGIPADLTQINNVMGYLGLGLFVFISGYLLNTSKSLLSLRSIWKFLVKRYIRILPLYVFAMSLFHFLGISSFGLSSALVHLFCLQIVAASEYIRPTKTLWYVGLIMSYYYIFVFCKKICRENTTYILGFYMAILFLGFLLIGLADVMDERFIIFLGIFLMGLISSKKRWLEKFTHANLPVAIVLLLGSIFIYLRFIYPEIGHAPKKFGVFSIIFLEFLILINAIMILFVFVMYALARVISSWNIARVCNKISYASFCIYLFHRPIWTVMTQMINFDSIIFKAAYLMGVGIPLIVGMSYYVQKIYDQYLLERLGKYLAPSQ